MDLPTIVNDHRADALRVAGPQVVERPSVSTRATDVVTVTVNYKMREKILAMLRSLYQDTAGSPLVIQPVVVDNGSEDGIAAAIAAEFRGVERPPICITADRNLGFGRGNNLALRTFDAAYYFIANPDLVLLPDQPRTIDRLHAFMESAPYVGIVAPRLQLPDGATQPSCMRFPGFLDHPIYRIGLHRRYQWARARVERLHMANIDHTATRPVDWVTGAAMFIRASALRAAGYFDERYFLYCEDCDLCRSCWDRSWPVYYKGDVVVRHGHTRSSAAVPGLRSILVNPLTRVHIRSLVQYTAKWWGTRV